jgi:hypothetical protein
MHTLQKTKRLQKTAIIVGVFLLLAVPAGLLVASRYNQSMEAASVISVSPASGPDNGGTNVTITGTGFVTSAPTVVNFNYTGAVQTFTAPVTGTYKLEVWGAQGYPNNSGGKGGYSVGTISLTGGTTLSIYVGGNGYASGGWNGGGKSGGIASTYGGGATDIRQSGTALTNRIIVAGGGGARGDFGAAGVGGGTTGGAASKGSTREPEGGGGGTQLAGGGMANLTRPGNIGNLGIGGSGYTLNQSIAIGGGGGGYYGGGGGGCDANWDCSSGGGGSGYISSSLTNAQTIAGSTPFPAPTGSNETGHGGNGYARITSVSPATLATTVTFGGMAALNVKVINSTTITATTPTHITGAVDIVVNNAGATTTIKNSYTYDATKPTVSATNSTTTWYNVDRTAVVTATDTSLGGVRYATVATNPFTDLATCQTSGTATSHGASLIISTATTLWLCAYNAAGNYATWSGTYNVDKIKPTASATNASSNWYNANRTAVISADDTGGSNLISVRYSIDTNPFTSYATCGTGGTATSNGDSVAFNAAGSMLMYICASDKAGNYHVWSGTYRIDKTSPTLTLSPASGTAGISGVTVTLTAADTGGSSLAGLYYQETTSATNPFTSLSACQNTGTAITTGSTVTVNTAGTRYLYVCAYDGAGNYKVATGTYTIQAPPTVLSVSPNKGVTAITGKVVTITGTNFTNVSAVTVGGIACATYTVTNSTTISCTLPSFSTSGTKSILVTASGGTNTANTLYTVVSQYITVSATNLNLSTNPGRFSSGKSTVTVSTNAPDGYRLSFNASPANLVHTTIPTLTIPTLTGYTASSPASASTVTGLIGGTSFWGYRINGLSSFGATTIAETNTSTTAYSWATIPTTLTTIKTGTTTDNLSTDTPQASDVWFGVSPRASQGSGVYTGTVTYTGVGSI